MVLLIDHTKIPEPGKIVEKHQLVPENVDTFLSFDQAFMNFSHPIPEKGEDYDGENLTWTTDLHVELPVRFNNFGYGSIAPFTLVEAFADAAKKFGPMPALFYRPKGKLDKPWVMYTWTQYWNDTVKVAKSLLSFNIVDKTVVSIFGFNQPAWLMAHFGAIFCNAIPSGIYSSSAAPLVKYILNHSQSAIIFCDTHENVDKVLSIAHEVPTLKKIVIYYDEMTPYYKDKGVVTFQEFIELGHGVPDITLSQKMDMQKPGECSSLIYTSGTTGPPKGVMISHDNAVWTGYMTKLYTDASPDDRVLSYLPLSHIAAQIIDAYTPLHSGQKVYFANSDALQGSLLMSLKEVRPTWFLGVPRVWEKLEAGLKAAAANSSPMKKKMMNWVRKVAYEGLTSILNGNPPSKTFTFVDHMFLNKIRAALGLDQCKGMAVSAAPILPSTQEFFMSVGMCVANIYGLSETTGPQCFSACAQHWFKMGSCGFALNGVESYVEMPSQNGVGQLCARGRNVFMGYYKDKEATKKVVDKNGFFKTGDTAYIDEKGRHYIVGRLKELIITAGGENVPPILIEGFVKEEIPFMTNCILVGDAQPYLILLLCVKADMKADGSFTQNLTADFKAFLKSHGSNSTTTVEASKDPVLAKIIDNHMKHVNSKVASRAHQIRKWVILHNDFSEATGELTSTLKLKRSVVLKKYKELIDSVYQSSDDAPQSKL